MSYETIDVGPVHVLTAPRDQGGACTLTCPHPSHLTECWHHQVPEDDRGAYRTCGECWHVFRTEGDLMDEVRAIDAQISKVCGVPMAPRTGAANVDTCPLCAHDF